jgi:uncharacterized membrane protein
MTGSTETNSNSGGDDALLLGACCTALATLLPVAMYQTGLLKWLPDPPARIFDSERIASSKAAHPFGVPDALLGIASFGTTLALILLSKKIPVVKTLLGAKLTLDAAAGTFNAGRQIVSFGKLCSFCTGTAISAGLMAYAGRDIIRHTWLDLESIAPDPDV